MLWILLGGILILHIIWFVTDTRSFKERSKDFFGQRIIPVYVMEALVLIPQIISSLYFPILKTSFDSYITFIGLILYFAGGLFATWAKLTMRKNWGLPAQHDIKRQDKLVTSGPFAISRNPIYLGLLLGSLGFSLSLHSIMVSLLIILIIYFYQVSLKEEELLEKYFGRQYLEYKKKVPRFFIF